MATYFTNTQPYLMKDRVVNLVLTDLVVCRLCHEMLWKPVACQTCEIPYCLSCIKTWILESKESVCCPSGCLKYTERKCPPAIVRILSDLKIICRYKVNGCCEILSYDKLETYEEICDYQLLTCSGCQEKFTKKDSDKHQSQCSLVSLTCNECSTVYQRQDAHEHTEIVCLRIQLHKHREQTIKNEQIQNDRMSRFESQMKVVIKALQQLK